MLTVEERRLIFQYCWEHPVASCVPCHAEYRLPELAADVFRGLSHLCPKCRADLSASAREHLASRTALRVQAREIRGRAQDARQVSVDFGKQSQQASDHADLLDAEAESVEDEASRFRARPRSEDGSTPSSA
jgi:hypothetical protein